MGATKAGIVSPAAGAGVSLARAQLPPWGHVLAVVAHPDDESFGLVLQPHLF